MRGCCMRSERANLQLDQTEKEGRILHPRVLGPEAVHLPPKTAKLGPLQEAIGSLF